MQSPTSCMREEGICSSFTPSTVGRTSLSPSITTFCASLTSSTSCSWSVPSESLCSRSSTPSSSTCIPSSPLSSRNTIPSAPGDSHSRSRSLAISSRCFFLRRAKSLRDIFTFGGGGGDCSRVGGVDSCVAGVDSCMGGVGSQDGGGESESRRDGVDSHIDDIGGVGSRMTDGVGACACDASIGGTILTSREVPSYTGLLSRSGTASTAEPAVLLSSNAGGGVCEWIGGVASLPDLDGAC